MSDIVSGTLAVIIAYLLGSIPAAYIVTRLKTGKDIRKLGGGNVGTRNVYRQVGLWPAIVVGFFDVAKGFAAVAIAIALLGLREPYFVLAAGIAVVVGHMWSVFLKFTGGNGLATAFGVLSLLMPWQMLIALAVTLALTVITRNPVLSVNISLFTLPVSLWLMGAKWQSIAFPLVLILIMAYHFYPTLKAAYVEAGGMGNFIDGLLRTETTKKGKQKKVK